MPTPQFPTGPEGMGLKALALNMLPVAEFETLPLPIVGELNGLRLGFAVLVAPYGRVVPGVVAEIEDRKSAGGRMVAKVQACESEGGDCCRALQRELSLELPEGKAEARFIHEIVGDQVVVRNDDVIIVLGVLIRWQEIVDGVKRRIGKGLRGEMFRAPADEHGLFGRNSAVEAHIETVGIAGRWGLLQIVGLRAEIGGAHIDIGRREIVIEQVRSDRINAVLRVSALSAAGNFVPGVRIAGERIHQWSGKRREIALTHSVGGNKEKEWSRKPSAIGFEVGEEEGFGSAVG